MRAVRKCCICCYPRLWSKKVDDGFASEATVPWNDNILLDWGLGSKWVNQSRKVQLLQSLEVSHVSQSLSEIIGARWCPMVPDLRCLATATTVTMSSTWRIQLLRWRPRARPTGGNEESLGHLGTSGNDEILSIHKGLHKILHNIILYKALNSIKLNRRSFV